MYTDDQGLRLIPECFRGLMNKSVSPNVRLGFIIPTMNRPESLNRLLRSIYEQGLKPECLIIVDGSDQSIETLLLRDESVELIYVREFPPSLTRQRNSGIRSIPEGLTHIGFLDDDLKLLAGSLRAAVSCLEKESHHLGGISFNIMDKIGRGRFHWLLVLMGQSSFTPGKICRSGFATGSLGVKRDHEAQWLCGGATIWRREILETFKFDEWFTGYALWEDVDFSYRVSKSYKLMVLEDAKVLHLHQGIETPDRAAKIGDIEIVDRFYFVKKNPEFFRLSHAVWASFWMIVRNLRMALKSRDRLYLIRSKSNVRAIIRCIFFEVKRGY